MRCLVNRVPHFPGILPFVEPNLPKGPNRAPVPSHQSRECENWAWTGIGLPIKTSHTYQAQIIPPPPLGFGLENGLLQACRPGEHRAAFCRFDFTKRLGCLGAFAGVTGSFPSGFITLLENCVEGTPSLGASPFRHMAPKAPPLRKGFRVCIPGFRV